jgi:hypothetical protein
VIHKQLYAVHLGKPNQAFSLHNVHHKWLLYKDVLAPGEIQLSNRGMVLGRSRDEHSICRIQLANRGRVANLRAPMSFAVRAAASTFRSKQPLTNSLP